MKISEFKKQFLKLPVEHQCKTAYRLRNEAPPEENVEVIKELADWALKQIPAQDQLSVLLPDMKTLEWYKQK